MPIQSDRGNLYVGASCPLATNEENWRILVENTSNRSVDFVGIPVGCPIGTQGSFRPLTGSEFEIPPEVWSRSIVGLISEKFQIKDDTNENDQLRLLRDEFGWAVHCACYGILLPSPLVENGCVHVMRYAREVMNLVESQVSSIVLLKVNALYECEKENASVSGWTVWNKFRMACCDDSNIGVALCLSKVAATTQQLQPDLDRWFGEPLKLLVIPVEIFVTQEDGHLDLPSVWKPFVKKCLEARVALMIESRGLSFQTKFPNLPHKSGFISSSLTNSKPFPSHAEDFPDLGKVESSSAKFYVLPAAIAAIHSMYKGLSRLTDVELYDLPFKDHLQLPLQPLQDNLDSRVYDVFEADRTKYHQYALALKRVLEDRMKEGKSLHVFAYLGAGRGMIYDTFFEVLREVQLEGQRLKFYALEKNPNATKSLVWKKQKSCYKEWGSVTIVEADMRDWCPSEKIDIIVSELLGSFGDNELSPECLDAAQHVLSEGGVMIPQSYYSTAEPVSCAKIWREASKASIDPNTLVVKNGTHSTNLDKGFVVQLKSMSIIADSRELKCFEFVHPNPDVNNMTNAVKRRNYHNSRYCHLEFNSLCDTVCHGLLCYFHAQLYEEVTCSISPKTKTPNMPSWYPYFLPLRTPIPLTKGDVIKFYLWRCTDKNRVWFEWNAECRNLVTPIQNLKGEGYSMSL